MDILEQIGIALTALVIYIVAFVIVAAIFFILNVLSLDFLNDAYIYVDLNGNEGYAYTCHHRYGPPECYKEDGTVILVQEYRKDK